MFSSTKEKNAVRCNITLKLCEKLNDENLAKTVAKSWQSCAETLMSQTDGFVKASIIPGRMVTAPAGICPEGGERMVTIIVSLPPGKEIDSSAKDSIQLIVEHVMYDLHVDEARIDWIDTIQSSIISRENN